MVEKFECTAVVLDYRVCKLQEKIIFKKKKKFMRRKSYVNSLVKLVRRKICRVSKLLEKTEGQFLNS